MIHVGVELLQPASSCHSLGEAGINDDQMFSYL